MSDASELRCFCCGEGRDSVVLYQCAADGKILCELCDIDCEVDGRG